MELENDLWRYALALYGSEGVESACLELQAAGVSINRLLFALWLGQEAGRRLQLAPMAAADRWQAEVTRPLRELRYRVRAEKQASDNFDTCYSAMRRAELACEQQELALLFVAAGSMPGALAGDTLAVENLARYLDSCTLVAGINIKPAVQRVLAAALSALPEDWAEQLS